jgi:predicted house-cleaning noncanonical NTP pyrophosphatase (MazG superfamily)
MSKLIRDKIPEIIITNNKNPNIKTITNDDEFFSFLKQKLVEEVNEFLKATDDNNAQEEIADIFEVIDEICDFKQYIKKNIEVCKDNKRNARGGFKKRIILLD